MATLEGKDLLLRAWAVQFTGASERLIDVDAERECLEDNGSWNSWKGKCLRYLFELEWREITNGVWIPDTMMTGILTLVYQQNER